MVLFITLGYSKESYCSQAYTPQIKNIFFFIRVNDLFELRSISSLGDFISARSPQSFRCRRLSFSLEVSLVHVLLSVRKAQVPEPRGSGGRRREPGSVTRAVLQALLQLLFRQVQTLVILAKEKIEKACFQSGLHLSRGTKWLVSVNNLFRGG